MCETERERERENETTKEKEYGLLKYQLKGFCSKCETQLALTYNISKL